MVQQLTDDERILAAGYVLGDLNPVQSQRFEQLLRANQVLRSEVNALQAALRVTPHALPQVVPPPHLREQILLAHAVAEPPIRRRARIPWGKIITGVAVLATLLLVADNLRLRQQLSYAQQDEAEAERVAVIMQRPNSRLIAIQGEGANAEAAGTLMFTPGQWQEVVVSLGDLPPLPPDQVYRMWLSLNNGQIIPCGEFNTNTQGSVFVRLTPSENPPQGTKASDIFVTIDSKAAPLEPQGEHILSGSI
ncbi:MAG: anti-sigma factor [Cyanobacteria bacterium CRU_2_1]|nr:anti-sigma factor [Cyanobacteria bacterium RU_5_0]NJR58117.1 anti-sigma factor [Cyanobacteria bacterium CRU_2_1]